jgi:hypothetical protein
MLYKRLVRTILLCYFNSYDNKEKALRTQRIKNRNAVFSLCISVSSLFYFG